MPPSSKTGAIVSLVGALYGLAYLANGLLTAERIQSVTTVEGAFLTLFMPFALYLYWRISHEKIFSPLAAAGIGKHFLRLEPYTYLVFLVSAGFPLGIQPSIALTIALWLFFFLAQACAFILPLDIGERRKLAGTEKYIAVLFLFSGFSALIYQVVWQRALYTTFGVNSESVTVVVSVFMFGLGIGSLAGGYLQKRYPRHLLKIFLLLEIAIGLFGLFSLDLIHAIGRSTTDISTTSLVLWVYAILALPTLMMGATLPVLVAFLQGYFRNIGKTVGILYAFNTLGSAVAAFCTVKLLFVYFGQQTSVLIAAACNFITAYLIFSASKMLRPVEAGLETGGSGHREAPRLPYAFTFIVLLAIGYISLSQEILWFRLIGFMTANRPEVFGLLLTAFLVGIAQGSLRSKQICESGQDPYTYLVRSLAFAIVVFYLSIPATALFTSLLVKEAGLVLAYIAVAAVAYLTGGILPMLIHVGIENNKGQSASSVAWLYFANIAGATLGPLLTGFVLLDRYPLETNIVILSGATVLLLLAIMAAIPKPRAYKLKMLQAALGIGLAAWFAHPFLYRDYLEKIQYATTDAKPFKYKLENRSGIITVETGSPDIMYGNGIYDGRFGTDPVVGNAHIVERIYMMAALHRQPRRVLEIGLSTGSWSKVIADYAPLEKMTVVEINKGYPEIIRNYPAIAAALKHPKVDLVFDDGRRWLRNHPDEKFDFIVMNTSFHWRSNATNILSKEFIELCRQHLNPGGVIYYNTTGSPDVVHTAARVFKHVTMYSHFVAASDAPFDMSADERKQNLLRFVDNDSRPLFDRDDAYRRKLGQLAAHKLMDIRQEYLARQGLWLVTDDNMAVEFKNPLF